MFGKRRTVTLPPRWPSMAAGHSAGPGDGLHRESSPIRKKTHSRELRVGRNLAGVATRGQTVYSAMAFWDLEIFGLAFTTIMNWGILAVP